MDKEKINLVLMNDSAYVWVAEDWLRLRHLRIVGNFIGSLAALPRQNQIAGLPLALLNEETTLLLEKGFAVLNRLPNILEPPDENTKKKSSVFRQNLLLEQSQLLINKRKEEIKSKIDIILEGKQKTRKRRKVQSEEPEKELDKDIVLQEEFEKIQQPKQSTLSIHLSTDDPWLQANDYEQCSWDHPKNYQENFRYLIFKDLWEKGYYITTGEKFGGDYLVYPGDPIKFHAFFIVICLEKNKQIGVNEFITYGRLGQSVRKTVTLAYLNEEKAVSYQSIKWDGS